MEQEKDLLDTPLLELPLPSGDSHSWTMRNAVEGVQIFGGIGSGKTSGSGRMIALKYLKAGFGGLVLTVKPDEKKDWEDYCALTGRGGDLIVIEPGGEHYFNFLDYESDGSKAITENIVEVLRTVIRAGEEKDSGKSDDGFWESALEMLLCSVIDLCQLAYGKVSVRTMYDIVQSLPKGEQPQDMEKNPFMKAFAAARARVKPEVDQWLAEQPLEILRKLKEEGSFEQTVNNAVPGARVISFIDQFFFESFGKLSEKTRSIIDFSFSGFLFRLLRDPVYTLFCRHASTFRPEQCAEGKIILLNLPVKLYHKVGRDVQIMFKYIWQRAMEKRAVDKKTLPVFLWADEAQNFLHEHDAEYQATARSSKIATVYISQNLMNYHANMGGGKSEYRVKAFLGTLNTKIFHANADIETNRYASELIGDKFYQEKTKTASVSGDFSSSQSVSMRLDKAVRPEDFASLKTGGNLNKNYVEGYVHMLGILKGRQGQSQNYIKAAFDQDFMKP